MSLIIKNLLHVLRRYKLAAILNILGLSVAFAAFMTIMMQLNYNFSFGKSHDDYDKIYRLEMIREGSTLANISRPVAERFFASSPHIVAGGLATPMLGGNAFFYIVKEEEYIFYEEPSLAVSPGFFDVFTFDFVEGSNRDLAQGSMLIPLSLSQKLFGNESAVGKHIFHSYGYDSKLAGSE